VKTTWLVLVFALLAVGCNFGPPPDPNDPKDVTVIQAEVLRRNLKWASDAANQRVAKGEITEKEARELVRQEAERLVNSVEIDRIPIESAWEYGEVFRTARQWEKARQVLVVAVQNAQNEDRRVNDSLRLAHVLAEQGNVEQAIAVARSVFNAGEGDRAPILPAILLEITPAAEGKGQDVQLAQLLEDAIPLHEKTLVDPNTDPGRAFMGAKRHHIGNAWAKVMDLYRKAKRPDLIEKAAARARESSSQRARV
jgi:hypothetical protein